MLNDMELCIYYKINGGVGLTSSVGEYLFNIGVWTVDVKLTREDSGMIQRGLPFLFRTFDFIPCMDLMT